MFNSDEKKCFQQYFCESIPKSEDNSKINCETYPVKTGITDSHICIENTSGEKPCKEQEKNKSNYFTPFKYISNK